MVVPPFQELVDTYWRDVARLCAALAGPQDAEDAAQRTWLQALRAYPNLRDGRNLRGWLLTVAARAAVDGHRDRARRPVPVATLPEPASHSAPVDHGYDGELWALVRALPERQRAAVALRYGLDLPHREVAASLGCTENASRRLVSDGLATLRKTLDKEA
ncbi:MAG: RNA polymerase sigma factor [Carbonactinosporaceae bacterium]